jgi:hypothetical protein
MMAGRPNEILQALIHSEIHSEIVSTTSLSPHINEKANRYHVYGISLLRKSQRVAFVRFPKYFILLTPQRLPTQLACFFSVSDQPSAIMEYVYIYILSYRQPLEPLIDHACFPKHVRTQPTAGTMPPTYTPPPPPPSSVKNAQPVDQLPGDYQDPLSSLHAHGAIVAKPSGMAKHPPPPWPISCRIPKNGSSSKIQNTCHNNSRARRENAVFQDPLLCKN